MAGLLPAPAAERGRLLMQRDINALIAFIESRHDTPHEWGRDKNDCVGFVLDAVKAQTGERREADWLDVASFSG
jgi:hypothetical protein